MFSYIRIEVILSWILEHVELAFPLMLAKSFAPSRVSWETMATYGTKCSLLVRQGDVTLHKEQKDVVQHGGDHTSNFTQVRAAVRRKTLLLLWWIDDVKMVAKRSTLAQQGW